MRAGILIGFLGFLSLVCWALVLGHQLGWAPLQNPDRSDPLHEAPFRVAILSRPAAASRPDDSRHVRRGVFAGPASRERSWERRPGNGAFSERRRDARIGRRGPRRPICGRDARG